MFRLDRVSSVQFDVFRTLMGFYSAALIGVLLLDRSLFFVFGPFFAFACIIGMCSGLCWALNFHRRIVAVTYLVSLAYIVEVNPSALRVAPGYVGWIFLMSLFVAPTEGCRLRRLPATAEWPIAQYIHWSIVIVIAFSFSFSGITKILSPMWRAGRALEFFAGNPRYNWNLDLTLSHFVLSPVQDYVTMLVETAFFPAYLFRLTRRLAWCSLFALFIGIFMFMRVYFVAGGILVVLILLLPWRQRVADGS